MDRFFKAKPHYRKAAERVARCRLKAGGVPLHYVGFTENPGYYLIIECLIGGDVKRYPVPCAGADVLKYDVDCVIAAWSAANN